MIIFEVRYMETSSSRVTSKGQVVIPKKLREKYGIRPVTVIRWIEKGNGNIDGARIGGSD